MNGKILYFPGVQAVKRPLSEQSRKLGSDRQGLGATTSLGDELRLLSDGSYSLLYYALLAIPFLTAIPLIYQFLKN